MKVIAICLALLCANAFAQNPQTPTAPAQNNQPNAPMRFPEGTLIPAELQKTVDAHKVKSGDKVAPTMVAAEAPTESTPPPSSALPPGPTGKAPSK